MKKNPILIIGAGPIGLAAAAHLSIRNESFLVLEAGPQVGDNVKKWEHVPMFSPWKFNIDEASAQLLGNYGWTMPKADEIPTGRTLLSDYVLPLSETDEIKPFIRLNAEVVSISRKRISKIRDFGRENAPYVLRVNTPNGVEMIEGRAVIDASGTWKTPKPAGADGWPAIGEEDLKDRLVYGIPDILGKDRKRYQDKDVAVIGGGHSAINALLELADLKASNSNNVKLDWILTKGSVEDAYGGLDNDELPGRGKVGQRIKALVDTNWVRVHTPIFVDKINDRSGKLVISGSSPNGRIDLSSDEIIIATGLRPNLSMLRELRVSLDERMESPVRLAPLIDPNVHSCGSVAPHGEAELRHPEKDFYIVGMKSYGRAPTFLLATGYEQVRSVVAGLVGDWEAARDVRLQLPETGVCGVPRSVDPNAPTLENTIQASCCESKPVRASEIDENAHCC